MRGLIVALALLALTACASVSRPPVQAIVGFDAARLAGDWQVTQGAGDVSASVWRIRSLPGGFELQNGKNRYRLTPAGPGQFARDDGVKLVVLWADADGRTLVLGTPDRAFAVILERGAGARTSADRLKAAREILAWNGYGNEA